MADEKKKNVWSVQQEKGTGGWRVYRNGNPHSPIYNDREVAERLRADYERREAEGAKKEEKK